MSVHSDHLIYDRESYAADGQCAPASVYGAPEAPRYSVARYVVGRAPYPLGQLVEHAPAHTLDEARAMVPPGCVVTVRGPQHTGMVPVEAWRCDGDGGPLRRDAALPSPAAAAERGR